MRISSIGSFVAVFVLLVAFTPAHAQDDTAESNRWGFVIAPYLVAPHMNGQITVRDIPVDVDIGPSEIFDNLDFAFMLYLEMANQDWAIGLDGLYMNLGAKGQTPVTARDAEVDMKQLGITASGMRRVATWAEVGLGLRLNSIQGGLKVAPGQVLPGQDVSQTTTWLDPLFVARFIAPLASRWRLGLRGDLGGFGLGSDFTWQVFPFVGYRFSRLFELSVGYRALGIDYETGSGTELFRYDMVIFGPQIGFIFRI